jgi:hypothetical protein
MRGVLAKGSRHYSMNQPLYSDTEAVQLTLGVSNVNGLNRVSNESASICAKIKCLSRLADHIQRIGSYHSLESLFSLILSLLASCGAFLPLWSSLTPTGSIFRILL